MSKSRKGLKVDIKDPQKAILISVLSIEAKINTLIDLRIDQAVAGGADKTKLREKIDDAIETNLEGLLKKLKDLGV